MGTGTPISDVGEFGLVERIAAALAGQPAGGVEVGIGDDAAVVRLPGDGRAVVSTDMLVEGRHFRRDWSTGADVGARAAAQNLIDIAVMGARGTTLVVALGLPADLPVEWVTDLYAGMREEAGAQGAVIVGGDLVRADRVVISVTALGVLTGEAAVRRSGAQPGDVVAVAGRLGWAAAGLSILSRGFRTPRVLVDAHRRPQPPYAAAAAAAEAGATAMIDVSDGLVADLRHVAIASGVAVELDPSRAVVDEPVASAAAAFNADPLVWVLTGGEDHAVAATFPAGATLPEGFTVVGEVRDPAEVDVLDGPGITVGGRVPRSTGGHDHFAG
ncbi:MAG: thiamine-phosphate kinase [Candidatus Nanopelagicales bacterium]|jgi:thiamine-monophosphate kinase|nr:thiamine-phosphate kinase [Candidatus Nanopelagicales bacterium]